MFTTDDVARLRRMGDVIRIKRQCVDSEWRPNWYDELADRMEAWIDEAVPVDEVLNGTPDTPKRMETIRRADEVCRRVRDSAHEGKVTRSEARRAVRAVTQNRKDDE